jgi:hypothetical protein
MNNIQTFNPKTGRYEDSIPEPFHFGLFPWVCSRGSGVDLPVTATDTGGKPAFFSPGSNHEEEYF